jgi:hypothetical protein
MTTMLSAARTLTTQMARRAPAFHVTARGFPTRLGERDANYAWNKSCYSGIDYTISDDATVYEAVEKFAAYGVGETFPNCALYFIMMTCIYVLTYRVLINSKRTGCLVTKDSDGT